MSTTIRQTQGGIYSRKMLFRFVRVRLSRKLWATYKFRNRDIISRPLALLLGMLIGPAFALPAGEVVVGGSATVNRATADSMTVNQGTARAAINWQSFNIGTGQSVTFVQPNANSVILNRVVGNDSSAIYGSLKANGQVFLLNSNGVYFSPTASVNTGALVASSLAMSTADFMSGRMLFTAPQGMTPGSVVNKGTIISAANGYVMLAAPRVINEGLISAPGGSVGLVAGSRVLMDREGDGVMRFSVDAAVVGAIVSNSGVISADGGRVMLAASSLDGALATVVNQTGHIKANSIGKQGGVITLRAVGGDTIVDGGRIEANGTGVGSTGGTVQVLGDRVGLINGASVSATGTNGGGTVLIGGDFQGKNPEVQNASRTFVGKGVTINADATGNGDGGKVVVWADDITRYYGAISVRGGAAGGNGGNVEVSGKRDLVYRGTVDATAANGKVGTLLLDPTNIVVAAADPLDGSFTADLTTVDQFADADIGAGVSTIDVASINNAAANVTLQANNDITFNTPVNIAGAGIGLTAQAGNNIAWGANAITTNGGAISFTANDAGGTPTGTGGISGTGMLTSGGGAVTLNVPSGTGTIAVGAINSGAGLITINSSGAATQSGAFDGSGGLTKTGAGTLTLSQANTYTGVTTVSAGEVIASNASALGSTADGTSVASVARLTINGVDLGAEVITVNGGTLALSGAAPAVAAVTFGAAGSTLNYSGHSGTVGINQQAATAQGITAITGFGNVGTVVGNGANTTITGVNAGQTFNITGANAGTAGTLAFTAVGNLTGGIANDTFTLATGVPTFNGSIAGGGGTDSVIATDGTNAWQVTGANAGSLNTTTTFTAITNLGGGTGTDTLTGLATANAFSITGANTVVTSGMTGTSMNALVGGAAADTFTLATGVPTFNGSIAGGGGTDSVIATDGTNAWQVTGANAGSLNTTTTFTAITNLGGGTGTDTLTGLATANAFSITGANTVVTSGMTGTSMNALVGGAAADTFTLATGVPTFNGSIAGGGGTDSVIATDGTNAWQVTGANAGSLNTTTTFTAITNLGGGTGTDTLTGLATANAFSITGANTVVTSGMTGTSMNALVGGAAADTFTLATGVPTFNGSIAGGGGTDSVIATDGTNAWQVTGANAGSLNTTTTFTAITNLGGGTGTDTLTGLATANAFSITGANTVVTSGMTGTSMNALVGGAAADTFTLATGVPTFNGSIAGGGGTDSVIATDGTNAWQVTGANAGSLNTTTTFTAITNLGGGTGTDTLTGLATANAFSITGANTVVTSGMTGTSMNALVGGAAADTFTLATGVPTFNGSIAGGGGTDSVIATDGTNAWQVTGANAGSLNTTTTFTAITNLGGGTGTDTLTGLATANAFSITGANTVVTSGMTGTSMNALVGGAAADTFTLATGVPTFNGSIAGGGGTDSVIATDGTNAWQVTGANAGSLNTTTTFTAITNLGGGTGTDTLTGLATANAFSITGANTVVTSGMTGTSMNALVGGAAADTFTLATGVPTFNGSIAGGGGTDSVIATDGTNAWQVTGANAGSLNTTTTFTAITNLGGGSGADTFTFANAGTLTGNVAGGAGIDTLNLSAKTGAVTINQETGVATGSAGFSGIEVFVGNGISSNIIGPDPGQTFNITGADSGTAGGQSFSGVGNLTGGSGADTFVFANAGTLSGNVAGGAGSDTLNLSAKMGAVSINQQTGIATGSAGFSAIEAVVGNDGTTTANSTITGPNAGQTFNITGTNSGTAGALAFTGVGNLTGGTGADTFTGTGGSSIIGALTDATGATTLNGAITAGTVTIGGAATLGSAVTLATTGGGAIGFSSTLDGGFSLAINSTGTTTFSGAVGSTTALTSVVTDATGSTVINGGQVRTTGAQTYNDAVTGNNVTLTVTTAGNISATNTANDFTGTLSLNTTGASSDVAVTDANALNFGTSSIGGKLTAIAVTGNITQSGVVSTGATGSSFTTQAANASIDLSTQTNVLTGSVALSTTGAAGNASLKESGAIDLAASTVGGNLTVTSTGAITQSGKLAVTGTSGINAGGAAVTLADVTNDFGGAVAITTTGAASIKDANALGVTFTNTSTASAVAVGALTATLNNSGGTTLNGATVGTGGTSSDLGITSGGTTVFGASTVSGNLTVGSTGAVTQTGKLAVTGTSGINAGGAAVTLADVTNDFGGAVAITTTGAASIKDANALGVTFTNTSTASAVAVGALTATLNNSGGTTLNGATVGTGGTSSDLGITSGGTTVFGASTVSGNLTVGSTGAVTQTGKLAVTGTSGINAGGAAVTLADVTNDFGGAVAITTTGAASIKDANALGVTFTNTSTASAVAVGALTATLSNSGGTTLNGATVGTGGTSGDLGITSGGTTVFGASTVSGNLTVGSTGAVTQTGKLAVTGTSGINAGTSAVTLANAGNDFNSLAVTSGPLVIRDANALNVTALTVAPNSSINIQADGALTLVAGNINTGTADLRLSSGGALASLPGTLTGANITLQAAGLTLDKDVTTPGMLTIVSPTVNQTGGKLAVTGATDIVATTSVVLNRPLNDFVGTVSITSPSVMITDANKLTLNLRGTGDQTVSTTTAGDMTLTSQAARLTVDFTGVTGKAVLNFPLANYLNMLSVINPTFNGTSLEFNYGVSQLRAGSVAAAGSTSGFLVIGDKSATVSESNRGVVSARLKFLGNATLLCVNGLDCAPPNEAERVSPAITAVLQQAERDAQADAAGLGRIARKLKTNSIDIADLVAPLAIPSVVRRAPCAAEQEAGEASNGTCK